MSTQTRTGVELAACRSPPREIQAWARLEVEGATLAQLRAPRGMTQEEVVAQRAVAVRGFARRAERARGAGRPLRRYAAAVGYRAVTYLLYDEAERMVPLRTEPTLAELMRPSRRGEETRERS